MTGGPGPRATVRPADWRGLEALVLENAALRVTVVPAMGGHVAGPVGRDAARDLLWHNPWAVPRPTPDGAYFDDWRSRSSRGVVVVFDRSVLPDAWLWQVYGGCRGHRHVAPEAWKIHPMYLDGALAAGRARTLGPGEVLETEVAFALHAGLDDVGGVDRECEGILIR